MKNFSDKFLTIQEIAKVLRVSRHTVQAWVSPSSPNHRPEFAALARHAGRKTVFVEEEVLAWLNQRRGPVYAGVASERSAYWQERFFAGRGLLKGTLRSPESNATHLPFQAGMVGLDMEPLFCWLADGPGANALHDLALRAEGLVMPVPLAAYVLRRAARIPTKFRKVQEFILDWNIFELAPLNEEALRRILELPANLSELSLQNYCCCVAKGINVFLTGNKNLLKIPGLPLISF
ncbi:MAG: hypothetical protein Kow0029_15410 [Candidatus Rifleibacteriota bacterium]